MTALCVANGPSSPNSGLPTDIGLTVGAIATLLGLSGNAYLAPFAAMAGAVSYHLTTLCATDPPGYQAFTDIEMANLFSLNDFGSFLTAQRKLRENIDTWVWYQNCHCNSGATPTSPTPPAAPSGAPVINPPSVGTPFPTGMPCLSVATHGSITIGAPDSSGPFQPLNGATYGTITVTWTGANPVSGTYVIAVQYLNASGGFVGQGSFTQISTGGIITTSGGAIPAGATQYRIVTSNQSAYNGTNSWSGTFDFYCGTTPGGSGPIPQPCQTDPSIQLYLGQILQLLTLVQRSAVPFAYVGGASHIGLTGVGVLTIPSLLGVKVTLTTQPTFIGEEFGDPLEIFDAGWFSWGSTDGFLAREIISHNPQLSFPAKAEQYTRLGYSLSPGVVATIQELYAET